AGPSCRRCPRPRRRPTRRCSAWRPCGLALERRRWTGQRSCGQGSFDRCGAHDCTRGPVRRRSTDGCETVFDGARRYHRGVIETDQRVILPDAPQYNASLVRREDANESLSTFWVRFDGDATPFESGQYMTIGVFVEAPETPTGTKIVQRPYSVASDP